MYPVLCPRYDVSWSLTAVITDIILRVPVGADRIVVTYLLFPYDPRESMSARLPVDRQVRGRVWSKRPAHGPRGVTSDLHPHQRSINTSRTSRNSPSSTIRRKSVDWRDGLRRVTRRPQSGW